MHFSKKKFPKSLSVQKLLVPLQPQISKVVFAQMAESVDALVSNTSGATHPGSSPGLGTPKKLSIPCKSLICKGFFFSAPHPRIPPPPWPSRAMIQNIWLKSCVEILIEPASEIAVFAPSERQKRDIRLPKGIFGVAIGHLSSFERPAIAPRKTIFRRAIHA